MSSGDMIASQAGAALMIQSRISLHKIREELVSPQLTASPSSLPISDSLDTTEFDCSPGFRQLQRQLLHHFDAVTTFTFFDEELQRIWYDGATRESLGHPFLMHGLLALSALHLGHSLVDKRPFYLNIAVKHQNLALSISRACLGNVNPRNCNAFFVFTSMLALFEFALPQSPGMGPLSISVPEVLHVMHLPRGTNAICAVSWEWLLAGEFAPLMRLGVIKRIYGLPEDSIEALIRLQDLNEATLQDEDDRTANLSALEELIACFGDHEDDDTWAERGYRPLIWPNLVKDRYMMLLRQQQSMAMIILAHYCVMLDALNNYWWLKDWGCAAVMAIYQQLGPDWRPHVQWAVDKVRERRAGLQT